MHPSVSRRLALAASIASVLLVALVAATPGSPFQPVLPPGAGPSGPFRWLADAVGLDAVHGTALAVVGLVSVVAAAAAFLLVLREAWRGTLAVRTVVVLAIAYHVVVLLLPLLFSRDVYSYAAYGRIAGVHHANPYVATPADFPRDGVVAYVGPKWLDTPAVYGPAFTALSTALTRALRSLPALILAFRTIAVAASLGTLALVGWLARRLAPGRTAFALAAFGLNPVVLFQSVGSGHNDLLVALAVAGALALLVVRRDLLATAVLALGGLVKATALVPLALLIVAAAARSRPGSRVRTVVAHVAVAVAVGLVFAVPFLQTKDPTLGMLELAGHEGWLAPSRFFHRVLGAASGGTLGVVARVAFPLLLLAAVVAIARALVRRAAAAGPRADGAAWGWGLIVLMLLGPVLLPWYVTWALPLVWLLPRVPRVALIGTGVALTVSQWTSEPARFRAAYDANIWFGHYVLTPLVIALLAWVGLDLVRRTRSDAPLEDEPCEVSAGGRDG